MVIIWRGLFSTVWFAIILLNSEGHKVIDKIIAHLNSLSWPNALLRLRLCNISSWWQPRRGANIS